MFGGYHSKTMIGLPGVTLARVYFQVLFSRAGALATSMNYIKGNVPQFQRGIPS